MLRLFLHLDPHLAIGTTLALIVPTSIAGAYNYLRSKLIDLDMVKLLILPAIIGTLAGAELSLLVQGKTLMLLFTGLITLSGLDLVTGFSQRLKDNAANHSTDLRRRHWLNVLPVGLLVGFLAGFFGVGGGFILVPILLAVFNMNAKSAFGTSLLVVASLAIPGTVDHMFHQNVNFGLVLLMALAAIPASVLGSKLALKLKDSSLRRAFGVIMLALAAFMLSKEL